MTIRLVVWRKDPSDNNVALSQGVDRTSELRKKGFAGRRLGPIQMTTDTAVRVTRMVIQQKCQAIVPMECALEAEGSL